MNTHENGSGSGTVVLNVDDNDDARYSLSWYLRMHGYAVREAATGAEALSFVREQPDIVLLDVMLPDQNGFEVCRQIKANPSTASIPVLMLSGAAVRPEDHITGLEGGADGYLSKPVDPVLVLAHVKALVRVRQAERVRRQAAVVLETTTDCFVTFDREWRYTYVNKQAARVLRKNPADLLGRCVWEVFPELPGSARGQEYRRAVAERVTVEIEEFFPALNVWLEIRAFPADDGLTCVFRDVTERHKLEEQYRQAQKMEAFGQLAGGVAHDFNNLLTIINGYGDIVLDSLPENHPTRSLVSEMRKAGERAANLTRQLLAFTRKAVVAPKILDLNGIVREVEPMLRPLIRQNLELKLDLADDLDRVRMDQGQLEQLLLNVVINARDAMPDGGQITIETRNQKVEPSALSGTQAVPPGEYAVLSVLDTGDGMPPETLARIFEPFFTTKPPGKGTGLGLATVHGIVQQAGGFLVVTSTVGLGTAFHVFLPRAALSATVPRPASREAPPAKETILLVQGDETIRGLSRCVLIHAGYTVLEAGRGNEAKHVTKNFDGAVHLLVVDAALSDMSGRELYEDFTARYPELKVLYLPGSTMSQGLCLTAEEVDRDFPNKLLSATGFTRKVRDVLDAAP